VPGLIVLYKRTNLASPASISLLSCVSAILFLL